MGEERHLNHSFKSVGTVFCSHPLRSQSTESENPCRNYLGEYTSRLLLPFLEGSLGRVKSVGMGYVLLLLMPGLHLLSLGWGQALSEHLVCPPAGPSWRLFAEPEAWVEKLRPHLAGPGMRQPPRGGSRRRM